MREVLFFCTGSVQVLSKKQVISEGCKLLRMYIFFIRVFQKIGTYRGEATLGAWIKRIAVHSAFNLMRKRKRNMEYTTDEIEMYDMNVESENEGTSFKPEHVHHAIKELPSGCRAVLSLYALEGYSHKEIAGILDITESTSKTQYRRAKGLLRNVLSDKMKSNEV